MKREREYKKMNYSFYLFIIFIQLTSCLLHANAYAKNELTYRLQTWTASISPENLTIWGEKANKKILLAQGAAKVFNKALVKNNQEIFFPEEELSVNFSTKNDRLIINFKSSKPQELNWPISGNDPIFESLILPSGEGLLIPLQDPFWLPLLEESKWQFLGADGGGGLSMPFWAYRFAKESLTYITHEAFDSELVLKKKNKKIYSMFSHKLKENENFSFEIAWDSSKESPIDSALVFRNILEEEKGIVPLTEKMSLNPGLSKLAGSLHAYVWGDGRTKDFLTKLKKMGINNAVLIFEDKEPRADKEKQKNPWMKPQHYVDEDFVKLGINLGYLVGPYDSWHSMQESKLADSANVDFLGLYPEGCVRDKDQKIRAGFAGKGCALSSSALKNVPIGAKIVEERIKHFQKMGVNSYFLDCDGTGEFFDDFSPTHLQTKEQDQKLRLLRLRELAEKYHFVLGTETASYWAHPSIAYSHGSLSTFNKVLWPLLKNKTMFGGYWPPERLGLFFKPIQVDDTFRKAKYSPQYRIPLFETVFHHSFISTERWELPITKIPQLIKIRLLMEMLYGSPSIWAFDQKMLQDNQQLLTKINEFFPDFHKEIWIEKLEDFKILDEKGDVQQTLFGAANIITANFKEAAFGNYLPQSLTWEKKQDPRFKKIFKF